VSDRSERLYYLEAALRRLRQLSELADGPSLGSMALADEIDWLDCYIDEIRREK
jgi:hypothetical protein